MHFNDLNTMLITCLALLLGHLIHRLVPITEKYNLPSSVLGGFFFALFFLALRSLGLEISFSKQMQEPLMVMFFASVGFSASIRRLIEGGKPLMIFFGITCAVLLIQNILGIAFAMGLGQNPLFGVMTGSVSLVGGPGTALAFTEVFEKAGLENAGTIGLTAALGGIVCAGLFGGPLSTYLIQKFDLHSPFRGSGMPIKHGKNIVDVFEAKDLSYFTIVHFATLVLVMAVGAYVSLWIEKTGITLPIYIGAMLVAGVLRNIDDATEFINLQESWIDALGSAALAFFIAMSMMTLDFLSLRDIGLPIAAILLFQVAVLVIVTRFVVFPLMGRGYESAVLSGGFFGFMMGTVANAMANIETVQKQRGPALQAALFISVVGACFIDVVNATVILAFVNLFSGQ